jgi:isoleucyl-tRNA synthetase
LPHYGHILAGTIKDVVTRYATQTGHYVSRRFGWDCHGLPIEFEIDKEHGISSKQQVLEIGIDKYNGLCRGIVTRYCSEWEQIVTRMGRWIDFKDDYKTMEPWYMESVWWVFKQLWEKELVYKGFKVMPFSTGCTTPLSNFEVADSYRDGIVDPAVVVTFPIKGDTEGAMFVAWTTTPWTLPANVALCVNAEFTYVRVRDIKSGRIVILAESRLVQLYPAMTKKGYKGGEFEVLKSYTGTELVGMEYEPLFDFFEPEYAGRGFRVLADPYVDSESGTGVVHQAPAFGEDDFRVCMEFGVIRKGSSLPLPVDESGRFIEPVTPYKGMYFKDADPLIMDELKHRGRLWQRSSIVHRYPFCWRSDTPLMYRAVPSWFVRVESLRDRLLASNAETRWVPPFVSEKRFHNWLAAARDWCVSRNRYWGTPLPVWVSDDGEEMVCVGSREELASLAGIPVESLTDIHREFVDKIEIPSKRGKGTLKRIEEVFDCWFESGSMPYAQVHYPFRGEEATAAFEKHQFPADFIAEGLDQTRGWFYTLTVLSTALFDKPAFKNVIVNGLVLAEDGQKMSKRKKNYPDPMHIVRAYGADALRLYLINSPVVRAEPLKFSESGVVHTLRATMIPWYNTFRFMMTGIAHLSADQGHDFEPDPAVAAASRNLMDRWVMAATQRLVEFVRSEMEGYRLYTVVPRLVTFIDDLTNWYIRLNRSRLTGREGVTEARDSLSCLYEVLATVSRLMAPFTPFFAEWMYQRMRALHPARHVGTPIDQWGSAKSVHFLLVPEPNLALTDPAIERAVQIMQAVINAGRSTREHRGINTRTPVMTVQVAHKDRGVLDALRVVESYVKAELNCEEITMTTDVLSLCKMRVEAQPEVLGKLLGKQFPAVSTAAEAMTLEDIARFRSTGKIELAGVEVTAGLHVIREFTGDAIRFGAEFASDGTEEGEGALIVVMDCNITDELRRRGLAREITNRVQRLRKAAGLISTDTVHVFVEPRCASKEEDLRKYLHDVASGKSSAPPPAEAAAASTASPKEPPADSTEDDATTKKAAKKAAKKSMKKAIKKADTATAAAVADEWPTLPIDEAVRWTKLALEENAEFVSSTLRLAPLPLAAKPALASVIARDVADLPMGVKLDIVITSPLPLAFDETVAAAVKGDASMVRAVAATLASVDPASLPVDGTPLELHVNGTRLCLVVGKDVFRDSLSFGAASGDRWAPLGLGRLAAAYRAVRSPHH